MQMAEGTTNTSSAKVAELKIPVPWGYVAAKTWGDTTCHPVLCVHGQLDNAATFDRLIPLLLHKQFYFVCIDLPGHGHSSHINPGIPYRFMDYLVLLKRIVDHFAWKQIYILGHNLGGLLGLYFASSYPDYVEKLIVLDVIHKTLPRQHHTDQMKLNAEYLFSAERDEVFHHVLSYQSLFQKFLSLRAKQSSATAIDGVISRNMQQIQGGNYVLTLDRRVGSIEYPIFDDKQVHIILRKLKCELLILTAKEITKNHDILPVTSLLHIFRRNCSRFEHHMIEGNRDLHLNFPDRVAPVLLKFIQEPKCSL